MGFKKIILILAFAVLSVFAFPTKTVEDPPTCGYESCPKGKPGMLNVHLIPHTHDDVGWLKTVDQYYFGAHPEIQRAGVQYILDSVIQSLLHDPNKRFIYVETAFFWKWWMRQHDSLRHQVKKLINSGQLEIIGGGWSMNDEAVTNYMSTIDQMSWGFRKMNETFGDCARPKIGWQIDPFGHSRDMASTFSLLGFDGLFIGRLDWSDKTARLKSKTAEMVWKASPNLGQKSWLFTGILYNNYGPPPGFCFDLMCDDEPLIDDKHSPDYNIDKRVKQFISYAENQSLSYATDNIIMTMGEDFNYQDAHAWFTNLDMLIRYVNAEQSKGSRVNIFYSTPSCYLKSLNDANITWPTKDDDFFPYASDPHTYWTGYYTSRPTLKYFERLGNNFLQVCKQLYSIANLGPEDMVDLDAMREAMGVMQHHDAITGTEKQLVAFDYARILSNGFQECGAVASAAINKLMTPPSVRSSDESKEESVEAVNIDFTSCLLTNISQCDISEGADPFVVTVYNPLSRVVSKYVRLPVSGATYSVKDTSGAQVPVQIVPIQKELKKLPGRESQATYELIFKAQNLPPFGIRSFFITRANNITPAVKIIKLGTGKNDKKLKDSVKDTIVIGKGSVTLGLDTESGLMQWVQSNGIKIQAKQEFLYYEGMQGNNEEFKNRSSGAYIFRPNGTEAKKIASGPVATTVIKGDIVDEVHQKFSDWVSQVIRVYKEDNHIEFNWLVGPIPVEDGVGKEVISRFTTEINNNGVFYTDSNGREMLLRRRRLVGDTSNSEEQDKIVEPIGGNYYPVTSRIRIAGPGTKMPLVFSVLTDRAQGGSSIQDGEVELMVHRRLLYDDAFGVGEALNETAYGTGLVARGRHFLVFDQMAMDAPVSPAYAKERELAERKLLSPWVFLAKAPSSFESMTENSLKEFQGLQTVLPPNVHVLTFEPWIGKSFLLRLEHFYEMNEDPELSKPVTVNLEEMFASMKFASIRETTLGANQWIEQSKKLVWRTETNHLVDGGSGIESSPENIFSKEPLDPSKILMNPMDIRTFVIEFA